MEDELSDGSRQWLSVLCDGLPYILKAIAGLDAKMDRVIWEVRHQAKIVAHKETETEK